MDKASQHSLAFVQGERVDLCKAVLLEWVTQLQLTQISATQAVNQMLHAFSAIEMQTLESSGAACHIDAIQKDRMYQGFQYQDRLNQMLDLVVRDIHRLYAVLNTEDADATSLRATDWLERLQNEFVMAEQHGLAPASNTARDSEAGNDVTFF
jgi:hypothetical protein